MIKELQDKAIELLKNMIKTPSLSSEENKTGDLIEAFFKGQGLETHRENNNVWSFAKGWDDSLPTILLNSHHDTVKANKGWTYDPFGATVEGDKLTGLGSNDAGGPLVSLIATYCYFYEKEDRGFNLIVAATAEEETSGPKGIISILDKIGKVDLGIVGEPTQMDIAVAEKGLVVIDVKTKGKSGHAAREEGVNAIYKSLKDIHWFETFKFDKISDVLGPVKMTVTQINSGYQHNVVPDVCEFVVDIRPNELYSNQEVLDIVKENIDSDFESRSYRLNSSRINLDHPIVLKAISLGMTPYGSPTISDQAMVNFTTIKMGPGDSARSHTPDEYIYMNEIREGIEKYIKLLEGLKMEKNK
jgi:acetylornithine deacetylase